MLIGLLMVGAALGPPPSRAAACVGDCDGNGTVIVNELILMVNVVLGSAPLARCTAGDADGDGAITVDEVIVAVNNSLGVCPLPSATPSATPSPTPSAMPSVTPSATPPSTPSTTPSKTPPATPSATPPVATPTLTPTVAALGTRHFVLDRARSTFTVVLSPSQSLSLGSFQGQKNGVVGQSAYLDLQAGPPDSHGFAILDVVDASDYLYVDASASAQVVVCIKPLVPVISAGLVACNGGLDFSLSITQNHHLGQVSIDNFTVAQCTSQGGTIESASAPHPGVCNGTYEVSQLGGDSGPGAVSISPVPQLGLQGFPVQIKNEAALPCGDEGPGAPALFALTSAASQSTILNFNNVTGVCSAGTTGHSCSTDADCNSAAGAGDGVCGAKFQYDSHGENFSCADWQAGTVPGCLVYSAPQLDAAPMTSADLVTVFTFCGR